MRTNPADKGLFQGSCNRQACLKPGATWYNHGTHRYYCANCAQLINRANPEAKQDMGHELCVQGKYERS